METSHGMPSFIFNNSNSRMISKGEFIVLVPTKTERVEPIGGTKSPSCVRIVVLDFSFSSLCREFNKRVSYIITFTQFVGSTRTPITMFPLMWARMYKGEGCFLMGKSYGAKFLYGDSFTGWVGGIGVNETMFTYFENLGEAEQEGSTIMFTEWYIKGFM